MIITKTLLIRVDAGLAIGSGHLMRCLALAEAWKDDGGDVIVVLATSAPSLEGRLASEVTGILHITSDPGSEEDACDTIQIAQDHAITWIVVDGYHFGAEYQKTIRDAGLSLLVIDDYGHAAHYYADIVLNQNVYADMSFYKKNYEPFTRFLLGINYILIRKEFLKWSDWNRTIPKVARKILITLGGSDPDNITLNVIDAVKEVGNGDLEVIVIVGGINPHYDLIHENVKNLSNFRLITNADNMPELMAWADAAISAGGSTCWELLFMGVPSLVIPIAENQEPVARELEFLRIAQVIDAATVKNPGKLTKTFAGFLQSQKIRAGFSRRMAGYMDGKGPARIVSALCAPRITLRKVGPSDCKMIWAWINDPLVRSVSFNPRPISLEHHKEWFSSALANSDLDYYIAIKKDSVPVGQARFQIESGEAIISVLVDPGYRGRSLGSTLIRDATEQFFRERSIDIVKAFIKTGNEVSRKAFASAGYTGQGLCEYHGEKAYLFTKMRGIR